MAFPNTALAARGDVEQRITNCCWVRLITQITCWSQAVAWIYTEFFVFVSNAVGPFCGVLVLHEVVLCHLNTASSTVCQEYLRMYRAIQIWVMMCIYVWMDMGGGFDTDILKRNVEHAKCTKHVVVITFETISKRLSYSFSLLRHHVVLPWSTPHHLILLSRFNIWRVYHRSLQFECIYPDTLALCEVFTIT